MNFEERIKDYLEANKHSALILFLLAVDVIAYSRYPHAFLGVIGFFLIVAYLGIDFVKPGKGGADWRKAAKELAIAVGFAAGAWIIACFLLNTSAPLNVVTSCSMLPELERGDLIILQGADYLVDEAASGEDYSRVEYATNPYVITGGTQPSAIMLQDATLDGEPLFEYPLRACSVVMRDGNEYSAPCAPEVNFQGESHSSDGNDILVFEPEPRVYGLIIHRALLKINAEDGAYYLTKGDNNQFADQRAGMQLVREEDVKGRVLLRVPLLGYLKLFFFWQFDEPPGCDRVLYERMTY